MEENNKGHRDRLRSKFLKSGLKSFHDYEIVEMLLNLSTPRKDCKQTAKALLKEFKKLPKIFEADNSELKKIKGIGDKNLFSLKLIKEVADKYLEEKIVEKNYIKNKFELINFLKYHLGHKSIELFLCIFLDSTSKIISVETLSSGTLNYNAIYPREIIKEALKKNAASIIFVHNHPSGNIEPSTQDIEITKKLIFACDLIGIKVLEHLIIGNNLHFSFADNDYIKNFYNEAKKLLK